MDLALALCIISSAILLFFPQYYYRPRKWLQRSDITIKSKKDDEDIAIACAGIRKLKRAYKSNLSISYEDLAEQCREPGESPKIIELYRESYYHTIEASRSKFIIFNDSLYHEWERVQEKYILRTEVKSDFKRWIYERAEWSGAGSSVIFRTYRHDNFMYVIESMSILQALGIYRPSRDESLSIVLSRVLISNLKRYIKMDLENLREQVDGHR